MSRDFMRQRAKELRWRPTTAENRMWRLLRRRRLDGHKFRRQHPIGCCVADFACVERRLVVEVDGPYHTAARNAERDGRLAEHGYRVVHVTNAEVFRTPWAVLERIRGELRRGG